MSIDASGAQTSPAGAEGRMEMLEPLTPLEAGSMVVFLLVTEVGQ